MTPPPALFIFDLDGTLVDSREDIARACNFALTSHGRAPLPRARIETFVGDGARLLIARAFEVAVDSAEVDSPLAAFYEFYVEHPCDATTVLEGATEVLTTFAKLAKLAVCTNKPRVTTERVLEAVGLAPFFPFVYAGGDGPLKPDPFGIHACCKHFDVLPAAAWMIGDGPQDIVAGKNAGATSVAMSTGLFAAHANVLDAAPERVVRDFAELSRLVSL